MRWSVCLLLLLPVFGKLNVLQQKLNTLNAADKPAEDTPQLKHPDNILSAPEKTSSPPSDSLNMVKANLLSAKSQLKYSGGNNLDTYSDCYCQAWNTNNQTSATICTHWQCWGQNTAATNCFAGESMVTRREDGLIPLRDLRIGDSILTLKEGNGQYMPVWDTVFGFLHVERASNYEFLSLGWTDARSGVSQALRITSQHLVFKMGSSGSDMEAVFADTLSVGDVVMTPAGPASLQTVERAVMRGVYAPITYSGTVVVDGVLSSCYASFPSHVVAHASMAPWRWFAALAERIPALKNVDADVSGVHPYPTFLMTILSP